MADQSPLVELLNQAANVFTLASNLGRTIHELRSPRDATGWAQLAPTFDQFCQVLSDLREPIQNPPDGFASVAKWLNDAARIAKTMRDVMQTSEGQATAAYLDFFPDLNSIAIGGWQAVQEIPTSLRKNDPLAFADEPRIAVAAKQLLTTLDQYPANTVGHVQFIERVRDEVHEAAEAKRQRLSNRYPNETFAQWIGGIKWGEARERITLLTGLPADVVGQVASVLRRDLDVGTVEQTDELLGPVVRMLRDALERASDDNRAAVNDQINVTDHLEVKVIKSGHPESPAEPQVQVTVGSRHRIQRQASADERCLNINEYADVVAELFASANDEEKFTFGLFGHWGRGKTFLIDRVAERLQDRGYTPVRFSAWKYRSLPEVWIHLYETIIESLKFGNWFLPTRTSFVRVGPWPAVIATLALWGALQTVGQQVTTLLSIVRFLGLAGLVYSVFVYWRMRSFAGQMTRLYLSLPRHNEKLGLQAALGADLRTLLVGWRQGTILQWNRDSRPFWLTQHLENVFAFVIYTACCLAVAWQLIQMVLLRTLNSYLPEGLQATASGTLIASVFAVAWALLAVIMPCIALWPQTHNRRLLLIVDDLDRCHPDEMLQIVESMLLLLDDDEIGRRLQVCILVDEIALQHALLKKYSFLTCDEHNRGDDYRFSPERIIRENFDKFFLVHLRLPPVNGDELKDLFTSFLRIERRFGKEGGDLTAVDDSAIKRVKGLSELGELGYGTGVPASTAGSRGDGLDESGQTGPVSTDTEVELTEHEKHAIFYTVDELQKCANGATWGPRTVRALIFRYQLARMLLTKLNHKVDPAELARAVAIPVNASEAYADSSPTLAAVEKIVQQVL